MFGATAALETGVGRVGLPAAALLVENQGEGPGEVLVIVRTGRGTGTKSAPRRRAGPGRLLCVRLPWARRVEDEGPFMVVGEQVDVADIWWGLSSFGDCELPPYN